MSLNEKTAWFGLLVFLLACWLTLCVRGQPAPPRMGLVIPPPETNWVWFAATAMDENGLESEYSNEVKAPYTYLPVTVTLAWDRPVCTNVLTRYTIY